MIKKGEKTLKNKTTYNLSKILLNVPLMGQTRLTTF